MVLDASVAIAAVLPEDNSELADALLVQVVRQRAVVPVFWPVEIGNALLVAQRRLLITGEERRAALGHLARLPFDLDTETPARSWNTIADVAERRGLSLYDAAYLELAIRRRLPLATFDAALRRAAAEAAVPLA